MPLPFSLGDVVSVMVSLPHSLEQELCRVECVLAQSHPPITRRICPQHMNLGPRRLDL